MGPQPPLKRRPTYTRPCKRDISAKLTPVGVHPHTRTGAKSQAIILLADRYIYIYTHIYIFIYIYIHTHVDTVATNRYLTVTSLDIFRPLPTHFHPVFSVVCPPEFALFSPDIFDFQLFHRYPCFVTVRSLFHLDASASFPPILSYIGGRLIVFEKFNFDDTTMIDLIHFLSLSISRSKTHLLFPRKLSKEDSNRCVPKRLLETFLDSFSFRG